MRIILACLAVLFCINDARGQAIVVLSDSQDVLIPLSGIWTNVDMEGFDSWGVTNYSSNEATLLFAPAANGTQGGELRLIFDSYASLYLNSGTAVGLMTSSEVELDAMGEVVDGLTSYSVTATSEATIRADAASSSESVELQVNMYGVIDFGAGIGSHGSIDYEVGDEFLYVTAREDDVGWDDIDQSEEVDFVPEGADAELEVEFFMTVEDGTVLDILTESSLYGSDYSINVPLGYNAKDSCEVVSNLVVQIVP